jgi:hypothetical protein
MHVQYGFFYLICTDQARIYSVARRNYSSLAPPTTEHGANAALALGYLVACGKDDPTEGLIINNAQIILTVG